MVEAKSHYRNWRHLLAGHKTNPSDEGSNWRRYNSRICLYLTVVMFGEAAFSWAFNGDGLDVSVFAAIFFSVNALWFFYWAILLPPFRNGAGVDPARLLFDTVVSTAYMIAVFSLWYRIFGLLPSHNALDTWYFSAVTFSTLGYGDFGPSPKAQVFSAIQAILGNLHLGMIVGATFAATQRERV